ncbi:MAG: hypothetical protein K8I82_27015 [Anaerolineae bacterium]|nr:hypothetical protein [Anaerolineae bacterium]
MSLFPKRPATIQTRIRSYENALKKEKKQFGAYDDSYGRRYLIGPLYLLLGDLKGALKAFRWFEKNFPDDGGDPLHLLCWTLALYQSSNMEAARKKLQQTMLSNLYVIPHLLGIEQKPLDIWHGSNIAEQGYVSYIPSEIFILWNEPAREWLRTTYEFPDIQQIRERYIEIYYALKTEPRGPKRTELVREASVLMGWDSG